MPLIPAILLGYKTSKKLEKINSPILEPEPTLVKIVKMFYQTEIDGRVCPICRDHREVSFARGGWDPLDPDIPVIGPAEFNGDTHWGCRCHFDITTDIELRAQLYAELKEAHDVYQVAQVAQQYWSNT